MLTTAIIAFREFLEAFLLIGIFLGMDKKFQLNKQKEILFASFLGILLSLFLPLIVFFFAGSVQHILTEKNTDILEGYFLTFSGFFLAYVIFSLHEFMKNGKKKTMLQTNQKMEQKIFDISLFFTIVFFITREGFEIALLIAATSIFSVFKTNTEGLLLGFAVASLIGVATSRAYITVSVKKLFTYTEYLIMIIGAAMVKNGISLLLKNYLEVDLGKFFSLPLHFLPSDTTVLGHALNNLLGIQQDMGVMQIVMMLMYVLLVWGLFRNHQNRFHEVAQK